MIKTPCPESDYIDLAQGYNRLDRGAKRRGWLCDIGLPEKIHDRWKRELSHDGRF